MSELLHMGGYGFFVWTSYAISGLVLLLIYLAPKKRLKNLFREVKLMHENKSS